MPDDIAASLKKKLATIRRDEEERRAEKRAAELNLSYLHPSRAPVSLDAVKLIPEADAKEAKVICIQTSVHTAAVATVDPRVSAAEKILRSLKERDYAVKVFIVSETSFIELLHWYTLLPREVKKITGKVEISEDHLEAFARELTTLRAMHEALGKTDFENTTTAAFLERILCGILPNRVSDLHFEAREKQAKLRFRVDGVLHDVFDAIPLKTYNALMSRIKLLSGLKINIRNEAQDGRFTIRLGKKEIEMRVSVIPAEFGETVVMRVLDPDSISIGLPLLGLREDDLALVKKNLAYPNGLILNTGPTGSGKTTTLYAFLKEVNTPDVKIITVEDPIEYHLPGVSQTQVNRDAGYTFASGLRSILRQDPDVILVGEIRDQETADIAMQASLTGHLVFSTLHTNDAVGAVPRLVDLGVKPATIGPALTLVIAQRLVRRLCEFCRKSSPFTPEEKTRLADFLKNLPARVDRTRYEALTVYSSGSCERCSNLGYHGRIAIYEFLEFGPTFEELVLQGASEVAMRKLAESQAMVTMQTDGILKVLLGITTFEEVETVTGKILW